jgi:antitoxin ParD1/3/4
MAQMNLSIPEKLKEYVEARVADGAYASSSDYIRDLIRQEQRYHERVARLQAEIDIGLASPLSERSAEQISADARARIADMARRKNAA